MTPTNPPPLPMGEKVEPLTDYERVIMEGWLSENAGKLEVDLVAREIATIRSHWEDAEQECSDIASDRDALHRAEGER